MTKKQIFIIIIIVLVTFFGVSFYNAGVVLKTNVTNVESKYSKLDDYLKRRIEVGNSFYSIVRPLMPEQKNLFESLRHNNIQLASLKDVEERSKANAALAGNINQITIIAKENANVSRNESYRALLQEHLQSTALLARAATEYNAAVDEYNQSLYRFPQSAIVPFKGYKPASKFKMAEGNTYYRVGEAEQKPEERR